MKNQSVSDFVAATMDAVLNSKEHKDLFATQYKKAKDSMCTKHGKMDSCAADDQDAKKSSSSSSSDSSSADDDNDARKHKKDSDDDSCMADDDNDARKHKKDSSSDESSADDDDNDARKHSKESSSDSSDADDDNDAKKKGKGCKECGGKLVFGKCPKCDKKSDSSDADDHDDFDTSSKAGQHLGYERDNGEYDKHFADPEGSKDPATGATVSAGGSKIEFPTDTIKGPKSSGKADSHSANTLASSQKNPYPPSFEGPPKVAGDTSAAFDVAIDSLLTASAALDSLGLGRGSALVLKLASLTVEAKKKDKKEKDSKKSSKDSHSAKDKKSKDSKKDDKKSSSKDSHSAKDKKSDKKDDKKSSKSSSSSKK